MAAIQKKETRSFKQDSVALDPWQSEVITAKGNIVLRSGRQVGKSTAISVKAGKFALANPHKNILIVASVERQAQLLFEKTLAWVTANYPKLIAKGKDKPTKHKLTLTNGSVIYCLPTGLSGYGIRGYTVHMLIADEAAFIPEAVWTAVTPMLAVTGGDIILLSTPFGDSGYFYDCFQDPNFTKFHVSSEDCPRISKAFLAFEKSRMTKAQYAQEYKGEFVHELSRFFSEELITQTLSLDRHIPLPPVGGLYLGVDVAGMGTDENVLFEVEGSKDRRGNWNIMQRGLTISEQMRTTETVKRILAYDAIKNYKKIFIDDGGMGIAVFDPLLEHEQTKRKVEALNNSSRALDRHGDKSKRILKEDLYNNLLYIMESGRISLFNDERIALSLRSIQKEYKDGKLRISGKYSHITEALIRACWCTRDKSLSLWIR